MLNLKGLRYDYLAVNLAAEGGQQHAAEYHKLNPQELGPVLVDGERVVRQSMSIIEYLAEVYHRSSGYSLMPPTARERAPRALDRATGRLRYPSTEQSARARNFGAVRRQSGAEGGLEDRGGFWMWKNCWAATLRPASFAKADAADLGRLLRVLKVTTRAASASTCSRFPTIARINERCLSMSEFDLAQPEKQPDAPGE